MLAALLAVVGGCAGVAPPPAAGEGAPPGAAGPHAAAADWARGIARDEAGALTAAGEAAAVPGDFWLGYRLAFVDAAEALRARLRPLLVRYGKWRVADGAGPPPGASPAGAAAPEAVLEALAPFVEEQRSLLKGDGRWFVLVGMSGEALARVVAEQWAAPGEATNEHARWARFLAVRAPVNAGAESSSRESP